MALTVQGQWCGDKSFAVETTKFILTGSFTSDDNVRSMESGTAFEEEHENIAPDEFREELKYTNRYSLGHGVLALRSIGTRRADRNRYPARRDGHPHQTGEYITLPAYSPDCGLSSI